jgi:hypothetical protein
MQLANITSTSGSGTFTSIHITLSRYVRHVSSETFKPAKVNEIKYSWAIRHVSYSKMTNVPVIRIYVQILMMGAEMTPETSLILKKLSQLTG